MTWENVEQTVISAHIVEVTAMSKVMVNREVRQQQNGWARLRSRIVRSAGVVALAGVMAACGVSADSDLPDQGAEPGIGSETNTPGVTHETPGTDANNGLADDNTDDEFLQDDAEMPGAFNPETAQIGDILTTEEQMQAAEAAGFRVTHDGEILVIPLNIADFPPGTEFPHELLPSVASAQFDAFMAGDRRSLKT